MGYGGLLWQSKRQINLFLREGYTILAMDFYDVLRRKDPQDLVVLMNDVESEMQRHNVISQDTIIFGVSMGGLIGFNMLKRHEALNKLIVVTGGDMTHIPARVPVKRSLKKHWGISQAELGRAWQKVNIYSPIGSFSGKHIFMVLPSRDKVIEPQEVIDEIMKHSASNNMEIIRTPGGHFRTIITETMIKPRHGLQLIKQMHK